MGLTSSADIPKLISELKSLKNHSFTDDTQRKDIYAAMREASLSIESPLESVNRVTHSVLELAAAKIGVDIGLFSCLTHTPNKELRMEELVQATACKPDLLVRLLRYFASVGMIGEVAEGRFVASNISRAFAQPGLAAGITHNYNNQVPCFIALPEYLSENNYQNPTDNTHTAFQKAFHTDLPAFTWAMSQGPELIKTFGLWMEAHKAGLPTWLDVVPFRQICTNKNPETPIFVDVGGSMGHQCAALKAKYPDIPGRIIYQDLPPVIEHGLRIPGVESMAYDFYQQQPIKGSNIYYFRNVMHDYPDEKCLKILHNTVQAMDENSLIFIDEIILSDFNAYPDATQMDLGMMSALAGMERTDKQWHALADKAGLKIKEVFTYIKDMRESILVLVKK